MSRQAADVLAPPPRAVPALTPLYLVLITTQISWLLLLLTGWVFWNYCAFGADVKAVLFRAPLRTVTGTVTRVARTRLREGTGGVLAGSPDHISTQPIYAVRYAYPLLAGDKKPGGTGSGTSYVGGSDEGLAAGLSDDPAAQSAPTLQPGMTAPIEYVRVRPAVSRIWGMRSNVYPTFVLISLAFPAGSLFFMWPGLRSYGRIRALLGAGVEDEKHENLEDPSGRLLKFPIDGPAAGWLGIRDGQLHAPSALGFGLTLLLPVLALAGNGIFIRNHMADIVFTWHTLTGGN